MSARRAVWGLGVLALLLGVGHMSFLAAYPRWGVDALWFGGTGLAFLLGGLLNLAAVRAGGDRLAGGIAVGGDLLLVGFALAAWTVLPAPQVAAAGLIFAALAAGTGLLSLRTPGPRAKRL